LWSRRLVLFVNNRNNNVRNNKTVAITFPSEVIAEIIEEMTNPRASALVVDFGQVSCIVTNLWRNLQHIGIFYCNNEKYLKPNHGTCQQILFKLTAVLGTHIRVVKIPVV
jgi:hypothetical protein